LTVTERGKELIAMETQNADVGQAPRSLFQRARHSAVRVFGYLLLNDSYLESQTEDQLIEGAFEAREREEFRNLSRDCEDAKRDLLARAGAYATQLGNADRARIEATVVKKAVHPHAHPRPRTF
jgi:hypothetical protein